MALPIIIIFALCGVFCLAPLAFYLAWLGAINRRVCPTVMSGGWDFACLLAGLSGFLIFGGGVLVAGLQSNFRVAARGNWEQLQAAWGQERYAWGTVALGYLLVVGGGSTLAILSRNRSLSVYNIDRDQAEDTVTGALADLGIVANRYGNLWSNSANGAAVIGIEYFDGLRHITLKFHGLDPRLSEELERSLRTRLGNVRSLPSSVASWLYSAAVACFTSMISCTILVAYFLYLTK